MCAALVLLAVFAMLPKSVTASHVWGPYHWRRTTSAIKLIPVRRLHSAIWVTRYNTAIADWRKAPMTKIKPYTAYIGPQTPSCPMVTGQVSSCDGSYGNNGWLGLASINISGSHILRGRAQMNNTYFNTPLYNTVPWRQLVICQELGHTFGLGHVNVVFNNPNTGSCMDYTNDPDGGSGGASPNDPNNMHPNAHDYALINSKHNHIGATLPTLLSGPDTADLPEPVVAAPQAMLDYNPVRLEDFGTLMASGDGGRTERYEVDFGSGHKVVNIVTWVKKPRR
jgi:hypothetical protein